MRPHVARYLRFLVLAAVVALAVAAVGWLPTRNLAGADGVTAMLVALALCWVASAFGGVPVLLAEAAVAAQAAGGQAGGSGPPQPRLPVVVAIGSMLVRMIVVLGLALAAALSGLVPVRPLLLWTALGYLALLGVDTWYVLATARTGSGKGGDRATEVGSDTRPDAAGENDETRSLTKLEAPRETGSTAELTE